MENKDKIDERFQKGVSVRFSEQWLAKQDPATARRFTDRIGVIGGYRLGAAEPFIFFQKDGRRKEISLFEIHPRYLVIV